MAFKFFKTLEETFNNIFNGDREDVVMANIVKKGTSALNVQLSIKKNNLISLEDKLEEAKEKVCVVLANNGEKEFNSDTYVQNYFNALDNIAQFQTEVDNLKTDIADLEAAIDYLNKK